MADLALTASGLAVRYSSGALGVADVSLEVPGGSVVALLGANGAGKTTTVRALSGFLRTEGARITSGRVELGGTDVTGWEPHRLARAGVAAVPERNKVFRNLTVHEHLASAGMHRGKAERAAAIERAMDLFPTLRERYRQAAGRMSGGQQQMLAIARALASCPTVLIVDEMTLGLHPSLAPVLFDAVRRIAADGTAMLVVDESVGHALATADHCYLIDGGRIAAHGTPDQVRGSALLGGDLLAGAEGA